MPTSDHQASTGHGLACPGYAWLGRQVDLPVLLCACSTDFLHRADPVALGHVRAGQLSER